MISRRAFFTFLAGGAALLTALWPWRAGLAETRIVTGTTAAPYDLSFMRALKQCEMIERRMAQDFAGLSLKRGVLIWKAMPNWIEGYGWQPTVSLAWKAEINGSKYGQWIVLDPEEYLGHWTLDRVGAKRLVEVLEISLDRAWHEIFSKFQLSLMA